MRAVLLLVLLAMTGPVAASWLRECLLVVEALSEPTVAQPDSWGEPQFEFHTRVVEAYSLKSTYAPEECTSLAGGELIVTLRQRHDEPRPKSGGTYYLHYSMYEDMCPSGGACSVERYGLVSEAHAAKLQADGI